jgi:hypothetical protein
MYTSKCHSLGVCVDVRKKCVDIKCCSYPRSNCSGSVTVDDVSRYH